MIHPLTMAPQKKPDLNPNPVPGLHKYRILNSFAIPNPGIMISRVQVLRGLFGLLHRRANRNDYHKPRHLCVQLQRCQQMIDSFGPFLHHPTDEHTTFPNECQTPLDPVLLSSICGTLKVESVVGPNASTETGSISLTFFRVESEHH